MTKELSFLMRQMKQMKEKNTDFLHTHKICRVLSRKIHNSSFSVYKVWTTKLKNCYIKLKN
jgi:hypothetical protein